jgi:hypothetical protein
MFRQFLVSHLVPVDGRYEVCFFPLAGAGGVRVLLALGGDDGEGGRGGGDEGPPKSQSSLSPPGREGGSTGAAIFPISVM